jgi:HD-GYP domain-containing protein (c-di-GMP phosphodiesterase class II)
MQQSGKTFKSFEHLLEEVSVFSFTTTKHETSVAIISLHLALHLGCDSILADSYYESAKIHDVGKIFISHDIIEKPGLLTDAERELVKYHTVEGCKILNYFHPDDILSYQAALYHHERIDGSGYPYGLKGNDIPEVARIISICDVYDALRSKRSYKEPMHHNDALRIMNESKHTYDSDMFNAFVKLDESLLDKIILDKSDLLT